MSTALAKDMERLSARPRTEEAQPDAQSIEAAQAAAIEKANPLLRRAPIAGQAGGGAARDPARGAPMSTAIVEAQLVLDERGREVGPTIDREAWKKVRGPRIGSSDMPAILGLDEYTGPWDVYDRIVLGEWKDATGADVRRGNRQEGNARECFVENFGIEVHELPMLEHPEDPRLVTDVDGVALRPAEWPDTVKQSPLWEPILDLDGPGWVEIKCPRVARFYRYKEQGLPRPYIVQGQHHGLVTGLSWGVFAFYTPEFDDLVAFPVLQDQAFSRWLFDAALEWYDRHVGALKRPVRPAPPPPRWPASVPGTATIHEEPEWREWSELTVLRFHELREAQEAYDQTVAELLKLLGEDEQHVSCMGVTVRRRSTSSQTRTDWKGFRTALLSAQRRGDTEALMTLTPDADRFKYQTNISEKVEVEVHVPDPRMVGA